MSEVGRGARWVAACHARPFSTVDSASARSRPASLSEGCQMWQHNRLFLSVLAVSGSIFATAPASAQEGSGDWSRIIRHRSCHPDNPCPARKGLLWDSTNVGPRYPLVMIAVGIGGETVLTFRVGVDGAVDSNSVTVVRTSNDAFAATSIEAVRLWRFGVESDQRPPEPISVQVQLIFSHEGVCGDSAAQQRTGWAATNQMVAAACAQQVPRSELRTPRRN